MKKLYEVRGVMLAFMFVLAAGAGGRAQNYYVSENGSDETGEGTQASPWATVHHAVEEADKFNGYATINVAAGTYTFASQLILPDSIHLVGAGDQTIFKIDSAWFHSEVDGDYHLDRFVIRVDTGANTSTQLLQDFLIDGQGKETWSGIFAGDINNIEIRGITIKDTYFTGLWLWDIANGSLHDSNFENCAWGSTGWQSGAVQLGEVTDTDLYNLEISEGVTDTTLYGYGMKALGIDTSSISLTNVRLFNSVFTCNPRGKYMNQNGSFPPNFAMEWWGIKLVNCEIYGNTFNNNVSLVNDVSPNETEFSVRVYDNKFLKPSGVGSESYYALELTENNVEIDHNHFNGGPWPIALWDNNGASASGWEIHHNIFNDIDYHFLRAERSLRDVRFYNNTCYVTENNIGSSSIHFQPADTSETITMKNIKLKNNIFAREGNNSILFLLAMGHVEFDSVTATHNCLYNVNPHDSSYYDTLDFNITDDPKFVATGAIPEPFFTLQSNSPCRNKGTNVGFAVFDGLPDIGAYEYGVESEIIDFSTQASGFGTLNNAEYDDVADIDVTFSPQIWRYDQSQSGFFGGPDHSFGSDNRMTLLTDAADDTIKFSSQVEVPSLWVSTLIYGQVNNATITGKLNGTQVWARSITTYNQWVEVSDGAGDPIDQIIFSGMENYALDDITILNNNADGSPGGRLAGEPAMAEKSKEPTSTNLVSYPNPVRSGEPVKLNLPEASTVRLLDVNGRQLKNIFIDDAYTEIPTDGLKGLYLIRVEGQSGRTRTFKVLVN